MELESVWTFFFDPQILASTAKRYHESYTQARPFPHVVIDDFFPEGVVAEVLKEFPSPSEIPWRRHEHAHSKKLATENEIQIGNFTRHFIAQLNSAVFVDFLEMLTDIEGLIPDPHLMGGGLHQIERGGYLGIHADFNVHPRLKLDRRLNLLLYLNKNWEEAYGGHLELWNREMTQCEKRLLPVFNRLVVFNTTDFSFHGHPLPLTCPPERARKSLALYYYTNGRPAEEVTASHSTLYQKRPQESLGEDKTISAKRFFKKLISFR